MATCTFFIKPSENPQNLEEIKDKLSKGTIQQKCKAMKQLVKCLVSDENYPPIIMHIISTIIPTQHQSQQLRKIMLLYWEVIQKCKSPTDKNLKQQIFLACNSLRNDLLCHNQYLRGRTLRLISRIMHRGVIQPLASAITNNLEHKSSYVRRNAVVCLYNVFINFGSDVIGDIDDDVEELLLKQTDLSTKRNAFLLLNKSNPQKALKYLEQQINFQAVQEIGDILQLAILKILKQKCKQDSSQKAKLLKIVNDFSVKASQSVKLQCALTSTSISNSPGTIKSSLYSYVNILTKTNELNVKKIILDKLELICKNSNYLQEDLIEDLVKGLQTPSIDIKIKILHIILTGITLKTSNLVLKQMQVQLNSVKDDKQYLIDVIKILQVITFRFPSQHQQILRFIIEKVFPLQQILRQGIESTQNILKKILIQSEKKQIFDLKFKILDQFNKINSKDLIKVVLNIFGNFFNKQQQIEKVINQLKLTIGSLPICVNIKTETQINNQTQEKEVEEKKVFKTVILQDGSYSTQLVHQKNLIQNQNLQKSQQNFSFRNSIAEDSIIGGIFARNISKLLYKIRKAPSFNKHACSILMILCSIIRYYEDNIFSVDQAIVQQISLLIRRIVNPTEFIKNNDSLFASQIQAPSQPKYQINQQTQMIQKNPQDMINFRLLKKGGDQFEHFDFDDDEVNDITNQQTDKKDYITKLKSLVQLTGAFDPLYSEAFVTVNKYDIFFQILLVNTTRNNLLNIQIQFSSPAPFMILQKAQSINLRSKQSAILRTQLRFSGNQFGVIYGYVNFDNHAGLQQPYLITEQINIDYMQFIQPAKISQNQFKSLWQRITNQQIVEQKHIPNKNNLTFKKIIQTYEEYLHAKCVQTLDSDQKDEYFLNCHLYGKSKLGQDFLINVALFAGQEISSTVTIRSKDQAVQQIVHKQLLKCSFENIEEQEEEQNQN